MATPDQALRAVLRQPFVEQIAAFRLRLGQLVPTRAWDDLQKAAHDRAFVVAGATKADLLADLALAVDRAIAEGTGLEQFRRDFRALVVRRGWHGWTGEGTRAGEAWRTRVIYQTNMRTSYAAGRMAQLRAAGFRYWIYRHGGSREPRLLHLSIDGLILPAEHPFWSIWAPPNGWGCSCWLAGAHTMRAAERRGGNPSVQLPEGWDQINPRTGAPEGIDKGWAYAPGASVSDTITLAAEKVATLPAPIAADFITSLDGVIERSWPVWLAEARGGRALRPALAGVMPDDLPGLPAEVSRAVDVVPAAVSDWSGWDGLPGHLRRPIAILGDDARATLIYLVAAPNGARQLVTLQRPEPGVPARVLSVQPANMIELAARIAAGVLGILLGGIG